ncbi:DUF6708 domain-containing protein [Paraburkholderia phymatum]|uniref:DUF6708 domain-containing protein n=1 Tax=Paraburkholderia phymatum (strain DSM 17167 / CIP 108236 / LMG 21445 / STM815) TaxID=391038 RepID=B2JTX2_PARP8|nr:DUF6708 domain-containing protein [Paraburkholderia phymatum]ACC76025.1 conserved hypothetical protein [Paraburkholderia phymatum STM815]
MRYIDLSQNIYRVNRKLTDEERQNQLRQKERLDLTPFYNVSTVTLNSTYLETVDRWFIYRGVMTFGCLLFIVFPILLVLMPFFVPPWHLIPTGSDLRYMKLTFPYFLPLWAFLIWVLFKESFRWTHFPIRFNYRNRMVYVFCLDGVIRSARWDDLFFTLGRCERTAAGQRWDIRGHALKADRETVEWTFALRADGVDVQQLRHIWEFVRRYMEEGPSTVYRDVFWCHDIAAKRETYRAGLDVLYLTFNGLPISQKVLTPVFWLIAIGRSFVMKTSRIPEWPAEIEAQCAVDGFDPYQRTAVQNPDRIPTESVGAAWDQVGS